MSGKSRIITKTDNDKQTFLLTIIGIVLAAMQVLTGINENQPLWQLILMISLASLTVILIISMWIPKIFFGLWWRNKRKILRGIYTKKEKVIDAQLIKIAKKMDLDHIAKNDYDRKRKVEIKYSMQFERDYRFLTINLSFKNDDGIELQFISKYVELSKKGNKLYLEFEFSNSHQVTEEIANDQTIPLIYGYAEMIFDMKTKELIKILFNKDEEVMTLAYIGFDD